MESIAAAATNPDAYLYYYDVLTVSRFLHSLYSYMYEMP